MCARCCAHSDVGREDSTLTSDFTDRRFLVLFSCIPGMREPDRTYTMLETNNIVNADSNGYQSSTSSPKVSVKLLTEKSTV